MASSKGIEDIKQLLKKNAELLHVIPKPKTNDILVHCCAEDVGWVKEHLLKQLEEKLKRKCYLSFRDGKDLGKDAVDAINDDLDSGANLLLVISQKYVAYSWHDYYVKMAHRKSISEAVPLVAVFIDDVEKMEFPEFCQIQPYLLHHVLFEWDAKAAAKAQDTFWKQLVDKYLTNKCNPRETITARKTVVSWKIPEKVGFIHTENLVFRKGSKKPVKQRSAIDSEMLNDQIIQEENGEFNMDHLDDLLIAEKVKPQGYIEHESLPGDVKDHGVLDMQNESTGTDHLPSDSTCSSNEDSDSGGQADAIRRKHDKLGSKKKQANRCDEIYLSKSNFSDNVCVPRCSSPNKLSHNSAQPSCNDVPANSTFSQEDTKKVSGTQKDEERVPVTEDIVQQSFVAEHYTVDMETLLKQLS